MFSRRRFTWKVPVQRPNGTVHEEVVNAFWSPDHPFTKAGVAVTARVQVQQRTKGEVAITGEPVLQGG